MNLSEALFPTRARPASSKPHEWANLLWGAWAMLWLLTILDGGLRWLTLGAFLALELLGVALHNRYAFGFTFSEVVWWQLPWKWGRWALGVALGVSTIFLVNAPAGIVLLVWLVPHFVMTGREYKRYAERVEDLAAMTLARNRDTFPTANDFLDTMVVDGDRELRDDIHRRCRHLAAHIDPPEPWGSTETH